MDLETVHLGRLESDIFSLLTQVGKTQGTTTIPEVEKELKIVGANVVRRLRHPTRIVVTVRGWVKTVTSQFPPPPVLSPTPTIRWPALAKYFLRALGTNPQVI
jgi:hypothetical protein